METKKPTIYIIDTENTGNNYIKAINNATREDIIILCVTDANKAMLTNSVAQTQLSIIPATKKAILCRNGRPNALDFQISCITGMMVNKYKSKCTYRIVSNDKGFTPMLSLLKDAGYDAQRIGTSDAPNKKPPKTLTKYGEFVTL